MLIDYSWGRPAPAAIIAAGYTGVLRYLAPDNPQTHGKILFADEAARLLDAGLDLAVVWESTENRVLAGANGGAEDGRRALEQARALGLPDHAAIYFAVDFDLSSYQLDALYDYCDSFAEEIRPHPAGGYGGLLAVTAAMAHGVPFGWQTIAWSHGRRASGICLMQGGQVVVDGVACDENEELGPYGGWIAPTPPTPPAAVTITAGTPTEEDMDTPHDIKVPELDDQGNGFIDLPATVTGRVKSCIANGQDPATNGYGHCPTFDSEVLGGIIRVNIHGGIPKGALDFTVWTTA